MNEAATGRDGSMERRDELEDEGIPDLGSGPSDEQIETGDPSEGIMPPRAHPVRADETTPEGQRRGEPLDERLMEEEPEEAPVPAQEPGQLVDDADEAGTDAEAELVGHDVGGEDENAPEERAMRIEPEAPGGVDRPPT